MIIVVFGSDEDSMDSDTANAAANMACVLNFIKKMLGIVSCSIIISLSLIPSQCLKVRNSVMRRHILLNLLLSQ